MLSTVGPDVDLALCTCHSATPSPQKQKKIFRGAVELILFCFFSASQSAQDTTDGTTTDGYLNSNLVAGLMKQ